MSLLFSSKRSTATIEQTNRLPKLEVKLDMVHSHIVKKVEERLNLTLLGKQDVVRKVLITTLAGGHLLLEDKPGVGKTMLAKALAQLIGGSFSRVQFTSDVLPADIVGGLVWHGEGKGMQYRQGPIMANIVLGDELNRASGRAQSALLEALEEGSVTIDGQTYSLPQPFMFIATQNPTTFTGTSVLPEAQLDRFMMKLSIGYPSELAEQQMLQLFMSYEEQSLKPIMTDLELLSCMKQVSQVHVHDSLLAYMSKIAWATRGDEQVQLPLSPRALREWLRAAQARALLESRGYVLPDDILYIAPDVLAHRIVLKGSKNQDLGTRFYIEKLLSQTHFDKARMEGK